MSMDSRIKDALTTTGLGVEAGIYTGENPVYYTFNYTTMGADYADDAPEHEHYLIQVHLFAPISVKVLFLKKRTKQLLWAAGFTWPSCEETTDGNVRHVIFECEESEGVDVDGDDEEL